MQPSSVYGLQGLETLEIKAHVADALQNLCPASLQQAEQRATAGWLPLSAGEEARHSQGELGSCCGQMHLLFGDAAPTLRPAQRCVSLSTALLSVKPRELEGIF